MSKVNGSQKMPSRMKEIMSLLNMGGKASEIFKSGKIVFTILEPHAKGSCDHSTHEVCV